MIHTTRRIFRCAMTTALAVTLVTFEAEAAAAELDLATAERLALTENPSIQAWKSRSVALDEMGRAASELPDPKIRMGVMSLPTDSFHLGQEPMTQLQLGLVQQFPRGDTRRLQSEQFHERAQGADRMSSDQALKTRLAVRERFLDVLTQLRLIEVNEQAEAAFSELVALTRDAFATGRARQQDVLRSGVELGRIRERSLRFGEQEQRARAHLSVLIGDPAWQVLSPAWPELPGPVARERIRASLDEHPGLEALHRELRASERGVELARQAYKPGFTVDLSYGGRGGLTMEGQDRPDLLSLMVTMDLPLFTERRQDRVTASQVAESSAARYRYDDRLREMRGELDQAWASHLLQQARIALFEEQLLPEARFNAEATQQAYQAALEDLSNVVRARIIEFDLQLDYIRLRAESLKTSARLAYFSGESS